MATEAAATIEVATATTTKMATTIIMGTVATATIDDNMEKNKKNGNYGGQNRLTQLELNAILAQSGQLKRMQTKITLQKSDTNAIQSGMQTMEAQLRSSEAAEEADERADLAKAEASAALQAGRAAEAGRIEPPTPDGSYKHMPEPLRPLMPKVSETVFTPAIHENFSKWDATKSIRRRRR